MTIKEIVLAEIPKEIIKFWDTLTDNEIKELGKVDTRVLAKLYLAGATFSLNVARKLQKEE